MSAAGVGLELGGVAGDGRRRRPGKLVIEPYHRVPVTVRDPDPQSPAVAASLAKMISKAVPGLRAEHVGSSAVPNLAGKGTIDLLLPTPAKGVPEVAEALQALGFQPQSVPRTFPATRPMLQGVIRHHGRPYRVHVHIVPDSSPEVHELRGFRDALRTDRSLRRDYEELKRSIVARGVTDAPDFTEAKRDFIVGALRRLGFR
ncbi:MAG TPA: GrpB family protein [Actinomycetota bacterium]|nr:GrpB family protein [Actinomycetota bacterium]